MSRRVFRLFACCIAVRGARRSTVCDLQRQSYQLIPNGMYDLLTEHRDGTIEEIRAAHGADDAGTIDEYFDFLEKHQFGFWTTDPEAFPALDLTWEAPELVTNALIDVGSGSRHDFPSLFRQLDDLRCKALQLRFFVPVAPEALAGILQHTRLGRLRAVEVLLPWNEAWTTDEIRATSLREQRLTRIFFHSAPRDGKLDLEDGTVAFFQVGPVDSHAHCGQVKPAYFSINPRFFTEAQRHNTCLNRKLSVAEDGEICNCPSLPRTWGNAADTPLHAALSKPGFRDLWTIDKDQVEVCRDCEFRYVCQDCRAFVRDAENPFSKPLKCSYDPYTAQWS